MTHLLLSLLLSINFAGIDTTINQAIADGAAPGVVLAVGNGNAIVYEKAYGHKALKPTTQPMTVDTIFDMASCTKSVCTATSVMILVERGQVDVHQPVAKYIPDFAANGKEQITVEQCLLHTSGLVADNPESDFVNGPAEAWKKINATKPTTQPGKGYTYSDVNFLVLGELVEKVSGKPLNRFAHDEIFVPLNMTDTGFLPEPRLRNRIAPTQFRKDHWAIGEVHDPRAFALGGVAGHAGLFSTAADIGKWCQMFTGGKSVLQPATLTLMTTPHDLPGGKGQRAYGLDVSSPYASNRGDRFDKGTTFGHTGYTGTSFWIDPIHKCFVVILANRVHPDDTKENSRLTVKLRRDVATEVAKLLLD